MRKQANPGQRLGIPEQNAPALKGRHTLLRPFRAGSVPTRYPGRCPWLACLRAFGPPLLRPHPKCMTGSNTISTVAEHETPANAEGVLSSSPGLRETSYPGFSIQEGNPTLKGLHPADRARARLQPFQGWSRFRRGTQGSARRATLGWRMKRRWRLLGFDATRVEQAYNP